jgi:hypothetical protein
MIFHNPGVQKFGGIEENVVKNISILSCQSLYCHVESILGQKQIKKKGWFPHCWPRTFVLTKHVDLKKREHSSLVFHYGPWNQRCSNFRNQRCSNFRVFTTIAIARWNKVNVRKTLSESDEKCHLQPAPQEVFFSFMFKHRSLLVTFTNDNDQSMDLLPILTDMQSDQC